MTIIITPMGVRGVLLPPHHHAVAKACLHNAGIENHPMCNTDRAMTLTEVLKSAGVTSVRTLNLGCETETTLCEIFRRNGIKAEVHHE